MADHHEVAHAWAHQTGRSCTGHNMFYDGRTIYSYGRHFAIARIVEAGNGSAILFTTRGYSVSTSKHKSIVRLACRHFDIFDVEDPASDDHAANFEGMIRVAFDLVAKAEKARTNRDSYLADAASQCERSNQYAALFGLRRQLLTLETLGVAVAGVERRLKAARAKVARQQREAAERQFREQEERRAAWLAGEGYWRGADVSGRARLRVSGDDLETSQGASVPLRHAVRAFRFVKLVRECGTEWHRNGHVIRVGHFHVDHIDSAGNIAAGCHRIGWSEIERIARQIGVFDAVASDDAFEINDGSTPDARPPFLALGRRAPGTGRRRGGLLLRLR